MKILHLINYYHEGFGYQENWLTYYLKAMGNEVLVVTSDYFFPFPSYKDTMEDSLGERYVGCGAYSDKGVEIIRKKSFLDAIGPPGIIWFCFKKEICNFKPDIVHVHGATNLWLLQVLYYQKKYGYKVFIDSHMDAMVENVSNSLPYRLHYSFWRFFYHKLGFAKRISKFLPVTKSAGEWLKNNIALDRSDMTISPLGVDLQSMSFNESSSQKFRSKHNIGNKIILVNAGKQYPAKRIDWIIEVAVKAKRMGIDIFLLLIGNAEKDYNEFINQEIQKLNGDVLRLSFLPRNELQEAYSACDFGAWPGVPSNTIQEAMACRVAVILPNNDIVGHLVNGNGILEAEDSQRVVEYIFEASQNRGKLEKIKKTSQLIAESYSWENISSDLERIYKA